MQLRQTDSDGEPLADVIRSAQAGDIAAFDRLIRRHYRHIYLIAWRWIGNRADAEDVAQAVAIKLANSLSTYDGRAAFTTWLYRIVFNTMRDWRRGEARRSRLMKAAALTAEIQRRPDQEDNLKIADIWRTVRELPEKQRDAVLLVYGQELSQAEAAAIMGCRETTVSWHIHKARKALRGML